MKKHYIARKYKKKQIPFNDRMGNIRIDLCSDYEEILDGYMGTFVKTRKSSDDAVMDFFRLQRRLIEQKPRKILKAKDLTCPAGYEEKLAYLERCIMQGKNLLPFLSKGIRNLQNEDLLLYDWGIYHFHISNEKDKQDPVFVERSDYLLMVYVESDTIYFLDIVPHRRTDVVVWADTRYLDIVKENWPHLFDRYVMNECTPMQVFNDKETYDLRKSGVSIISKWGERGAIFSPGGGYASDTTSVRAVQSRDYWMNQVSDLERVWVEYFGKDVLLSIQNAPTCEDIDFIDIKMISCTDSGYMFIERQTKLLFFVKKENNMWMIECVSNRIRRDK